MVGEIYVGKEHIGIREFIPMIDRPNLPQNGDSGKDVRNPTQSGQ
jgi:hypothetical protein